MRVGASDNFAPSSPKTSDMDNLTIKQNIRKARKKRNITKEEMADRLGISLTAYRDLEKGGTSVVHGKIMKMAELLETSTEEIVLGYTPSQLESRTLEDVQIQYGNQICTLEQRIGDLEKLVSSLEGQVASKDEIITMLKKRLDEVE